MNAPARKDRRLARASARERRRPSRAAKAVSDAAQRAFTLPLVSAKSLYSFWGLTIEPDAAVVADVSQGPVWVYIHRGPAIFRGAFATSDPSRLFVGIPGNTFESVEVLLGDQFTATLVAPNSNVIADMRGGTKLLGSFFVRTFELHQGRFLEHLPFPHPWVPTCSSGFESCF